MGRPALAEVHLEGVHAPRPVGVQGGGEVDAGPSDDAPSREALADHAGVVRQPRRVGGVGREPAAHVDLSSDSPEHLLVGGEHANAPVGQHVDLGARAGEARAGDQLLDDAPLGQVLQVPVRQCVERRPQLTRRAEVEDDVAVAGPAVIELQHHATDEGPRARGPRRSRPGRRRRIRTSSLPTGSGTPDSRNSRRPALLNPNGHSAGDEPLIGAPQRSATSTSSSVTFHGSMNAVRSADVVAKALDQVGAIEELRGDRRGAPASGTSSTWRRRRTVARRSGGSSET